MALIWPAGIIRNYIVQSGRCKGYRSDDADNAYWSVGYTLPTLPNYQGWRMRTFCIKCVSDNHINIEALPTELRTLVNIYHAEFGVGTVKNLNTFSVRCCNHPDESERRCRQCRARHDAAKITLQKKLKMESDSWAAGKDGMATTEWKRTKKVKDKEGL